MFREIVSSENPVQKKENVEKDKEEKIKKYLAENLPETETRIPEKMNANCEVCVVIPVFSERECIFRPLESLAKQKGVISSQYELIFVVNNPSSLPDKEDREDDSDYKRKIDVFYEGLEENQKVLDLVRFINGENVRIELSEEELQKVDMIRKSGLKVFAIDKANIGKTLPKKEANVGGARNRGVAEAVARFREIGRNGIIAQTDGDTRLDENYIHNLIKVFRESPELVGVAGLLKFEKMEANNRIVKLVSTYSNMEYYYENLLERIAISKKEEIKDKDNNQVHFSGANMSSRAWEAAIVGGVPKLPGGEDPAFGKKLAEVGKVEQSSDVQVTTADRRSARTAVWAGHGQQRIRVEESIKSAGTLKVESPDRKVFLDKIMNEIQELIRNKSVTFEKIKEMTTINGKQTLLDNDAKLMAERFKLVENIKDVERTQDIMDASDRFNANLDLAMPKIPIEEATEKIIEIFLSTFPEIKEKYDEKKEKMMQEENERVERGRRIVKTLVDIVFSDKPEKFSSRELIEVMKENKELLELKDESINDFEGDQESASSLAKTINSSKSREDAIENITNIFKDELTPIKDNPLKLRLVELRAMEYVMRDLYGGKL